jgi:hypothetical protein
MSLPKDMDAFDLSALNFESKINAKPIIAPQFTIIYGKGGVGKSSLTSYAKAPIILPLGRETGHEKMCIPKLPNHTELGIDPVSHVFAAFKWLRDAQHTRQTLIIDNVGAYKDIVEDDVEEANKGVDLKAYGKGSALAYPYWSRLARGIDMLMKKRGMDVILLGHDGTYTINNPDGSYYQKISVNAPSGEKTNVRADLERQAHNVFYIQEEALVAEEKRGMPQEGKKYAIGVKPKRVIYTQSVGNIFAKRRVQMQDRYIIKESPDQTALLKTRTNESIQQFFKDLYENE